LKVALKQMENLKYISVEKVTLHGISWKQWPHIYRFLTDPKSRHLTKLPKNIRRDHITLPRHPNLEHLRLIYCYAGHIPMLLFRNYSQQLVSLETRRTVNTCANDPNPFEKLTTLKLIDCYYAEEGSTLGKSAFEKLQNFYFCLNDRMCYWKELFRVVDQLPKSVVQIHFDVCVMDITQDDERVANMSERLFPLVKNLGIPYPTSGKDGEFILTKFLKKFPNLEYLDFVNPGLGDYDIVVKKGKLWENCLELKKIRVFEQRAIICTFSRPK